ncbi:protein nrx isoform l; protein nrx isoform k; pro tein nrx isoform b; protein nrx isoform a [Trichuris trichiura]|uniref:Protein nrx isoform l protein nrx isoform k pro tein nrx isoform b protein nrx isoform a n=1 Tax=Trichuris trichiura TaxID=36087 RepID=A0A077Z8Z6_TRITR|nr:protein nrx isoform l; protein nrx isoform k; pro tein nrx isoform b; protein nrx isoform a [Trichuris trichiura]
MWPHWTELVLKLLPVIRALLLIFSACNALTLEGSSSSYARFPRWYQAFENVLSVEIKSRASNGLLVYTDNGGQGNFYEISLHQSCVELTWRVGRFQVDSTGVHNLRNCHVKINDGRWHKVVLYHFWETIRLEVDDHKVSKTLHQQDFVFTDYEHAGDVFIGGLPVDYDSSSLSFPFVKALTRFQGSVRNLIYRTLPYGVTAPSMLQWQGVRASDTDYCALNDYCACYSSDTGPACNCPNDRSGTRCEIGKSFLFFSSFYRLLQPRRRGAQKIESVCISLYQGAVNVVSKTRGSEQDARVMPFKSSFSDQKLGFSDGHWHLLSFSRTLSQVTVRFCTFLHLSKQTTGRRSLQRLRFYLPYKLCLLKFCAQVRFEADGRSIDLIKELSVRNGLSRVVGDNLGRSCQHSFSSEAVTFLSSDGYLNATGWHGGISGQVGFRFRTKEPNGLLLYVGPAKMSSGNFFAIEMFNGHLYLSIDLGSGTLRLQLDRTPVNDGHWHAVNIHRNARTGSSSVDDWHVDFSTPGKERTLDSDAFMQIGALPWNSPNISPSVWTATLRQGFIGCIRDFTIDGILLDFVGLLPTLKEPPVEVGCYDMLPQCGDYVCQNEGRCVESWNSYRCDCTSVFYSGDHCEQSALSGNFIKIDHSLLNFSGMFTNLQHCIGLQLGNWRLECFIVSQGIFQVGISSLGQQLHYDFVSVGCMENSSANSVSWISKTYPGIDGSRFVGSISDLTFDGVDVLYLAWRQKIGDKSFSSSNVINFVSKNVQFSADEELVTTFYSGGYALVETVKSEVDTAEVMQISFSFRTSKADCILFHRHGDERGISSNLSYSLNDMNWHSVLLKHYDHGAAEITIDNVTTSKTSAKGDPEIVRYDRLFRFGSPLADVLESLKPVTGFEGCMMSVKINGVPKRLLRDCVSFEYLHQGCSGMSTVSGYRNSNFKFPRSTMRRRKRLPEEGYCVVTYKDRFSESRVEEKTVKISDGFHHTVKFQRAQLDLSITVDSGESVVEKMKGKVARLNVAPSSCLLA